MRRSRAAALLAVMAAGSLALTACGDDGDDGKGGSKAKSGGSYIEGINEPDDLTPGKTTSAYSSTVINALFDPLTQLDSSGKLEMLDAQSVTSSDQKVWTVKVRKGSKFSTGEAVTAKSYVDAWNNAAYGPNGAAANYYFANIQGYDDLNPEKGKPKAKTLTGLKVLDKQSFQVTLTGPFKDFPMTLATPFAFSPLPKEAYADAKKFKENPVGNGPFKMSGTWEHNKQIKVAKVAGYTGARKPHVSDITFRIYSNDDTQYNDVLSGGLDVGAVPPAKVPDAKRQLGDRLKEFPAGTMDYLGFPLWEKQYQKADVRKAISMAIDREGITKAVYNGAYKPMKSLIPPIVPGYKADACAKACSYDPKAAKALFDKAGGIDGTVTLWFSNADPTYQKWMRLVANNLKDNLGIKDIKFRNVPASDYLSLIGDAKQDGPYRQNWVMDYPTADNYLQSMWGTGNKMQWKGATYTKFTKLIDQAKAAASDSEKNSLYQQAQQLALDEMPMTPLWNWQGFVVYSDKLSAAPVDSYSYDGNGVRIEDVAVK